MSGTEEVRFVFTSNGTVADLMRIFEDYCEWSSRWEHQYAAPIYTEEPRLDDTRFVMALILADGTLLSELDKEVLLSGLSCSE